MVGAGKGGSGDRGVLIISLSNLSMSTGNGLRVWQR